MHLRQTSQESFQPTENPEMDSKAESFGIDGIEDSRDKSPIHYLMSSRALWFVLWVLGFVETKDDIKMWDDLAENPDGDDIRKLFESSGRPNNVAIHYEPC